MLTIIFLAASSILVGPLAFFLFNILVQRRRWAKKRKEWEKIKSKGPLFSIVKNEDGSEFVKWHREPYQWKS